MPNFFATRMLLSNKYEIKLKDTERRNTITATTTHDDDDDSDNAARRSSEREKKIKRKLEAEHMSSSINIMKLHRSVYVCIWKLSHSHSNENE